MSDANYDIEGLCDDGEDDLSQALMEELCWRRTEMTEMSEQIKRMGKERDEARRDVCYAEVNGQYGRRYKPQDIAKIKNWDCFTKDKTP